MAAIVYHAREGQKFAADLTLTVVTCPSCSMTYAIPASLQSSAREYPGNRPGGWSLTCPLGHGWHYTGETEEEKLRRQLEAARELTARRTAQLDQAKADARAQKAAKTRFKNQRDRDRQRVAAGVCPCCNRSFQNLGRHMAGQRPEFAVPASLEGETHG